MLLGQDLEKYSDNLIPCNWFRVIVRELILTLQPGAIFRLKKNLGHNFDCFGVLICPPGIMASSNVHLGIV